MAEQSARTAPATGNPIREAVRTTLAEGAARVREASRADSPVPSEQDVHGAGVVDFERERVWISPTRIARRGFARLLGPLGRRSREHFFEGLIHYRRQPDGSWSAGLPLRWSANGEQYGRETVHPLWLLAPLAMARTEPKLEWDGELVLGVRATRYSVTLAPAEVGPAAWRELGGTNASGPRSPGAVEVLVWLDAHGRVSRLSYEASSYHPMRMETAETGAGRRWAITELWDFGTRIDREPPSDDELARRADRTYSAAPSDSALDWARIAGARRGGTPGPGQPDEEPLPAPVRH
jgi:hypothetical protein